MISGSGGNLNDIAFNGRFLYYTILSDNVQPNKIPEITSEKEAPKKKLSLLTASLLTVDLQAPRETGSRCA